MSQDLKDLRGVGEVFVHGVLAGFAERGFRADTYASSSSTTSAAFAAAGRLDLLGPDFWASFLDLVQARGDVSSAVIELDHAAAALLLPLLFRPESARFIVAASAVVSPEAAALTQGEGARRLGQQLVISIRQKDSSWASISPISGSAT